ncbi:MAG: ABC transporter ATP-binding protein [Bacteroidales bacterium]|nr:ABC transporter ATP-binding protein [Bacteroidales bacterium]
MKNFRSCLKGMGAMLKPLRWRVAVGVGIGLVRIAASLAFVWICKRLVDIATGAVVAPLGGSIGLMAGILLVQILGNVGASWWESYITVEAQNGFRHSVFSHVLRSTWNGREAFHSGDTVNRLEEDIRVVVDLLCSRLPSAIVTLCQLVAASLFLLTLSPNLAWILIILMLAAVLGSRLFFRTLRRLTAAIRAKDSQVQAYMQENLLNRVVVLTLIGAERVLSRLGMLQRDVRDNTIRRTNFNAVARTFMGLGFLSGYAAAFLWGVFGIRSGAVTYGMMTAFLQLVGQIQRPIAELAHHVPAFIHSLTSVERLMELEELPLEEHGKPVQIEGAPEIAIEHLTFGYAGQAEAVFKDFSYVFKGGEMTAITGHTGIGKSTLIRLILALLRPQEGTIRVGGVPVSPDLRGNFMYVPQGNSLLSGTIRENLRLVAPEATDDQLREALELSAAEFVFELPDGLDTLCSEKGGGLSEGQAQRIAIARGLLHNGGILVLDEATSAIDPATEERLLHNLSARFHGRKTILFISHREAVTSAADAVLSIGAQRG